MSHYVTFALGMPLSKRYAQIPAEKLTEARNLVMAIYGTRWQNIVDKPPTDMEIVAWGTPNMDPPPLCTGCNRHPAQIEEYLSHAAAEGMTPDEFVTREEGTFNFSNGHFLCTACYIAAGSPTAKHGRWEAP